MTIKILHTADIHLGMKYSNYPSQIRGNLVEARYEALKNLINRANKSDANIFAITGDLFDKINISENEIMKTINILENFSGDIILIIPGNHDYDNGMIDLWNFFKKNISKKIKVLNKYSSLDIKLMKHDVRIYPAFCNSKHSSENRIKWFKDIVDQDKKIKIAMAHGALTDISPDLNNKYFSMNIKDLLNTNIDLWLLGHTHIPYPSQKEVQDNKIFNAGTPEADGFDFSAQSSAWLIEIDSNKKIKAERINIGHFTFLDLKEKITCKSDLDSLLKKITERDVENINLRLSLYGYLDEEIYHLKENYYHKLRDKLNYFLIDDSELKIKISKEIIKKEFNNNSFPYQLLIELADRYEDDQPLQIAYELIREVQK